MEIRGCWPRAPLPEASWADIPPGSIGRRGGEAALRRYVPARLLGRIVGWVERHRLLAVFLPAVLPPPIPLLPFALASGALGVSRRRFLAVYGAARTLRYSFIAWLGAVYGRRIVRMWSGSVQKWSTPFLCAVRRPVGSRRLFWNLEASRSAQNRCRRGTCITWLDS